MVVWEINVFYNVVGGALLRENTFYFTFSLVDIAA